jgi:sugar lactone lactonase YvrE
MAPQTHDAVQLECDVRATLGESPSWDEQSARLLSVDINGKLIFVYDPKMKKHVTVGLEEMVGAVMPTTQPNVLLAALEKDVVLVDYADPKAPQLRTIASTPDDHGKPSDGWRFNDAKASPEGALIAGRMHKGWRDGTAGRVYSLKSGGQLQEIMQQDTVTLPNGMAWDTQKQVMYFADTAANAIFSHETDAEGIPVGGKRKMAFATEDPPDGITIDSDGNLWVALAETGSVAGYSPSGELLHKVQLPVKRPTALTFGGDDLATLFITTRVETGDNPSPHAGSVFTVQVPGVKGAAGAYLYKI